jgi:hypothetical protein
MPTLSHNVQFTYGPGTRTASAHLSFDVDRPILSQIERGLNRAWNAWRDEHGEWLETGELVEDMFITIGFTTTEMIVEVSDRFRH